MKTLNNHPQWHDEPLRLTKEQKQNPYLVLEEFFQHFHLHEVRETSWNWLIAVLSSSGSISQNPIERSNHIFYYEKTEELVEACYVIRKMVHKYMRKKRRKSKHRKKG